MVEGEKTAGCLRNSCIEQIKCDARFKTFEKIKEKSSNKSELKIGVVNQPSKKKKKMKFIRALCIRDILLKNRNFVPI